MRPVGYIEFELQLGQWRGIERSLVLDFEADSNIILGLHWCMKWNVVLDFASLSFTVETKVGTLKIADGRGGMSLCRADMSLCRGLCCALVLATVNAAVNA